MAGGGRAQIQLGVYTGPTKRRTRGYVDRINKDLEPARRTAHTVLDLFAGCGGLSLGFESAGFESLGYEIDGRCCQTYNANLRGECRAARITTRTRLPEADAVIGGPPCQPFSVFGRQMGGGDARDGFPEFISAVRRSMPKIWMFENVRGMTYRNGGYLDRIIGKLGSLGYRVDCSLLNAADYGVPQNRIRLIAVGHDGSFEFPRAEPGAVTAGEALRGTLRRHSPGSKFLTPSMDRYVAAYEKKSCLANPRDLRPDRPARTLTCRNLSGATSDMHRIKLPDGRRRRLTVREGARLQSFPDWFKFAGTETEQFNQIGNAVSPLFARALALQVRKYLRGCLGKK